uniref:Uncharacterized protein n=1 Tax=Kalanchoe fedtschenkoi TaxID=63787 RepID=A0A7N0SZR2_KALFE
MRVSLITSLIRFNQMAFISNFVIHFIPAARLQHVVCNCVYLHNLITRLSPNNVLLPSFFKGRNVRKWRDLKGTR